MSRIEEALKRAKENNSSNYQLESSKSDSSKQLVSTTGTELANLDIRTSGATQIACMHEDQQLTQSELAQRKIIYPETRNDRVVNAFREVRTKLLQYVNGENCVVMITSISDGNGSSFIATNLSAAFAFDEGKTAVTIDCNLGNPSLHRLINTEGYKGITDFLEDDEVPVEKIIHSVGIQRFRVIPAGSRKEIATEYFTSLRMRYLLEQIKQRYQDRYIIIDTAPVLESADTRILIELCDFVLLVVPYGRITESKLLTAVNAIGSKKFLGVVFNDEPRIPKISFENTMRSLENTMRSLFKRAGG